MQKTKTFTVTERLSLDRLKHRRLSGRAGTTIRREETTTKSFGQVGDDKDLIANLLTPDADESADFERIVRERGARKFAEWIEKELKK